MILDDALIDLWHRAHVEMLRRYAEGFAQIRGDVAHGPVGTGYALYAGPGSPLTQAFGFAHREPQDPVLLEAFFGPLTDDWEVGVTPFTDTETVRAFLAQGYRFGGFEGELTQRLSVLPEEPDVEIVEVGEDRSLWLEATGRAWRDDESDAFRPQELERAPVRARRYVAMVDGVPAAGGMLNEMEDCAILSGGATRMPYRGRGLQTALIARRLRDAGRGRLVFMGAVPGSVSHRNAQRLGFEPLFSTLNLTRH